MFEYFPGFRAIHIGLFSSLAFVSLCWQASDAHGQDARVPGSNGPFGQTALSEIEKVDAVRAAEVVRKHVPPSQGLYCYPFEIDRRFHSLSGERSNPFSTPPVRYTF